MSMYSMRSGTKGSIANEGVYYAFDNFFSYSSVMDIEIERPIDRPATLRLCMTNLAHLFNFKLFDNSTSGKWEASLYKWAIEPGGPDAVSLPSDANAIGIAGREGIGGAPFALMGPDMMEGYAGGTRGKNKRIPLQYFPLQTGTKIQLRMGYTNNPNQVSPSCRNPKISHAGARRTGHRTALLLVEDTHFRAGQPSGSRLLFRCQRSCRLACWRGVSRFQVVSAIQANTRNCPSDTPQCLISHRGPTFSLNWVGDSVIPYLVLILLE
jgi:hypothetical protein